MDAVSELRHQCRVRQPLLRQPLRRQRWSAGPGCCWGPLPTCPRNKPKDAKPTSAPTCGRSAACCTRCSRGRRGARLGDAGAARLDLDDAKTELAAGAGRDVERDRTGRRRPVVWATVTVAIAAASAILGWASKPAPAPSATRDHTHGYRGSHGITPTGPPENSLGIQELTPDPVNARLHNDRNSLGIQEEDGRGIAGRSAPPQ